MSDYFTAGIAVSLILKRGNEILLQLRKGTGYADGSYGLVGGYIDGQEPATQALIREAQEEAGIVIAPEDLHFSCVVHRRAASDLEFVILMFTCETWRNEISNEEPDQCEELKFFSLDRLPDNMIPWVRTATERAFAKLPYYEQGWNE